MPKHLIHEPWKISPIERAGLDIGHSNKYPDPIVDNTISEGHQRKRFGQLKRQMKQKSFQDCAR